MPASAISPLRRLFANALATALASALLPCAAVAGDNWPSKPLHLIVGFPAGSSPDLTARALAEPLEKRLGQPVIVENKVGAGGNIAGEQVARARDGHTFSVMINGNLTIARLLNPAVRYDPVKDLQPVSLIGVAPLVLVAPAGAPEGRAFLEAASQAGSRWSYGSPGVGTVGHLGMELLKSRSALRPEHIPYPGYPQVFNAIQGGDLQLSMLPPALAMAQVQAGKLRGVAVTSAARSPLAPGLPSLKELGVGDFDLEIWNAVAAPKAMPAAHVQKLAEAVSEIVRSPEMRARLAAQGWQAVGSSPEGLALRIRQDVTALGRIIREQGIHAQ
ncbi:tripartite tricarboxylate transporter substrate binding protein [Delftia sp. HK171]|uniref:Bug family tripartite tricarboxylate transporter substrate binding protein n=1 Tax=Delftia sp. HK171 TaxID=1920191 RepID=UPI00114DC942|nr:tripartite tricarboxylate transporter substrate binding protein [Delftia sp. HK171]TQL83416.1 tripartite-type tricarboxylate transporter receptor subunit TctC [Delftia sp. HK171]